MALLTCPDCGASLRSFVGHDCSANKKTRDAKAPAERRPVVDADTRQPKKRASVEPDKTAAGLQPVPEVIKSKRGRPRIGEQRVKPWIEAGMSERTWYRRQKEKKK